MYQAIFFKTLSHASDHPQHFHQSQQMTDPVFALVRLTAGVTEYPRGPLKHVKESELKPGE